MHESNNLPKDSKMKPLDQQRVKLGGTLTDAALNCFAKEKFNYALIAFRKPIGGDLDVAFSGSGDSAAIIEALRNVANQMEKDNA